MNISSQTEVRRHKVKGVIWDESTKKQLGKFPIKISEFNRIVYSDDKGEFLFNMAEGNYTLIFDDYPFTKKEFKIQLRSDTTLNISLKTISGMHHLQTVDVLAARSFSQNPAGITQISVGELSQLPAMIGEPDLLQALSLKAGVSQSSEGAADIQVRGGTNGQNLFLLNNVPLYSTQHMFGMVSAFNPVIIQSAELYKSGFPAYYGGRIASVLDVQTKKPNLLKFSGEAGISIPSTKASFNIPLIKNKLGLNLAGRISNYSLLNIISAINLLDGEKIGLHFADMNASFRYKPDSINNFDLIFYYNGDGLNTKQSNGWLTDVNNINSNQQNVALNWERSFSGNVNNNFNIYIDLYRYKYGVEARGQNFQRESFFNSSNGILTLHLEDKLTMSLSEELNLTAGLTLKRSVFPPVKIEYTDTTYYSSSQKVSVNEITTFVQADYRPRPAHIFEMGFRASSFGNTNKTYYTVEPRIMYQYKPTLQFSINVSAGQMTQDIHRVANPGLGIPMDLYRPSDTWLKPQQSWVYAFGFAKDFSHYNKNQLSFNAELWYKSIWNAVEFRDGNDAFSMIYFHKPVTDTRDYLIQGKGYAYGVDFAGAYTSHRYKLSADYTWLTARNRFNELNNGNWFAASTDIRHSLSLISELKLAKKWTFTATWQYRSGRPVTLPTAVYYIPDINFDNTKVEFHPDYENIYNQSFQLVETGRNNARMKAFHKLDVALNRNYVFRRKYQATLSLGLYNVYNRANPTFYFISNTKRNGIYYPELKSFSIFPILPALTWSVRF